MRKKKMRPRRMRRRVRQRRNHELHLHLHQHLSTSRWWRLYERWDTAAGRRRCTMMTRRTVADIVIGCTSISDSRSRRCNKWRLISRCLQVRRFGFDNDGHKPWRPQDICHTATAMKTWRTNGVLVRNHQIHGHTVFQKTCLWPSWSLFVAVMVCGRHGLWPSWFMAVMVCGRHGLWPSWFVAVIVEPLNNGHDGHKHVFWKMVWSWIWWRSLNSTPLVFHVSIAVAVTV